MFRTASLAALLLASAPAAAAERNYTVTGFERIRVDGPYRVRLTTGVAPFAKAKGSAAALDSVSIEVEGRTLVVRENRSAWGNFAGKPSEPVEIALGTHELAAAWLNGAGSLVISRIEGLSFGLSIHGSGSAEIAEAEVDQLKVGISGSGSGTIAGTAKKLTALVRGTSTLDAGGLKVKDASVGVDGPSQVSVSVTGEAEVDAQGVASVALSGSPACTVRAKGSASVTGCKSSTGR